MGPGPLVDVVRDDGVHAGTHDGVEPLGFIAVFWGDETKVEVLDFALGNYPGSFFSIGGDAENASQVVTGACRNDSERLLAGCLDLHTVGNSSVATADNNSVDAVVVECVTEFFESSFFGDWGVAFHFQAEPFEFFQSLSASLSGATLGSIRVGEEGDLLYFNVFGSVVRFGHDLDSFREQVGRNSISMH